ncbi:helix-turn-helix domain-containing protein [Vibrio owensii]|uniref:helix-turn-helix domain-containing protein n=1 Tax=Vibrio owensii TaxID=696485 RepID=UPI003CC5F33F
MFHYTECGLSNIYLKSGYHLTDEGGEEFVSFEKLDLLHWWISHYLCKKTTRLSGEQVRFIRKEMNLTQEKFGEITFNDRQTVARWEKGQVPIPPMPDLMIKLICFESIAEELSVFEFYTRLKDAEIDQQKDKVVFEFINDSWQLSVNKEHAND